jgi:hypothetical protein
MRFSGTEFGRAGKGRAAGILTISIGACAGATEPTSGPPTGTLVEIRSVYTGIHCAAVSPQPSLTRIDSPAELEAAMARMQPGAVIGSVAFDRRRVVRIDMGVQPTAGYGVSLASSQARVDNGILELPLRWRAPPPGAMLAQVLTSPCVLVSVPDRGYRELRAIDQNGELRGRLQMPEVPE